MRRRSIFADPKGGEFTRTGQTTIVSNGSRWFGQDPATVAELLEVLAAEPLRRCFEVYGNFIIDCGDGETLFWGNFHTVSHVFNIRTRDADLIERLTKAIRANQERPDYLTQPVPEPLPAARCRQGSDSRRGGSGGPPSPGDRGVHVSSERGQ